MCHCVQLKVLFCCLWRNVEASCHKHFFVVSCHQHRRLLPAISVTTCGTVVRRHNIDNIWPVAALRRFPSKYYHAVWYRKSRMAWLPDGEKNLKICLFVLTECIRTWQTHGQTDTAWRLRPRLHSIARQKVKEWRMMREAMMTEMGWQVNEMNRDKTD